MRYGVWIVLTLTVVAWEITAVLWRNGNVNQWNHPTLSTLGVLEAI